MVICQETETDKPFAISFHSLQSYGHHQLQVKLGSNDISERLVDNRALHHPTAVILKNDQDLRNMRHHVHCHDLNEITGYYPQVCQEININSLGSKHAHCKGLNTNEIVYKHTQVTLGGMSTINNFNKNQLDMLAYTYPYHMQKSD